MNSYDKELLKDYYKEFCCCDCGYRKGEQAHPLIRCPKTGRCGICGDDWPCSEHSSCLTPEGLKKASRASYVKSDN